MTVPTNVIDQLEGFGLYNTGDIFYNLPPAGLYEHALANGEAKISADGPLLALTGDRTGRSPNDRFMVKEDSSSEHVAWGKTNVPVSEEMFDNLLKRIAAYTTDRNLYVRDLFAGADPRYRMPVRIVTEKAWHNLFANNMFLRPAGDDLKGFNPEFTVIDVCDFGAIPEIDGTNSDVFVIVNMARKLVIIGGTHYGGEIKKSIFSIMNYLLPFKGVMPMHCSANVGPEGDTAVFFGLSGTGKTTLSADASRTLIGDDEHGWADEGVFNFEGGCYAKTIKLSPEGEPEIFATTKMFGSVIENVVMDPETRALDFDDSTHSENTRVAYPIHYIPNASDTGMGGIPSNVIFLTADAFGVMPPISRLTTEQAMYHFMSGYTAKVAGTEAGVTEPQATFSACFGEPFMVLPPAKYAEMLGDKIRKSGARCWLVNTGWTGGAYGTGSRMKLKYTRAMVNAALAGKLDNVDTTTDAFFGLAIPTEVPNVPAEVLNPRNTWDDKAAYDKSAAKLADMFNENFKRYNHVSDEILAAGPVSEVTS